MVSTIRIRGSPRIAYLVPSCPPLRFHSFITDHHNSTHSCDISLQLTKTYLFFLLPICSKHRLSKRLAGNEPTRMFCDNIGGDNSKESFQYFNDTCAGCQFELGEINYTESNLLRLNQIKMLGHYT